MTAVAVNLDARRRPDLSAAVAARAGPRSALDPPSQQLRRCHPDRQSPTAPNAPALDARPRRQRGDYRRRRTRSSRAAPPRGWPRPWTPRTTPRCRRPSDAADGVARGARRRPPGLEDLRRSPTPCAAGARPLEAPCDGARRGGSTGGGASNPSPPDVRREKFAAKRRSPQAPPHGAICRSPNPAQSPDPHQRRIAVGHRPRHHHSLVAAVRHGGAVLPTNTGRPSCLGGALRREAAARGHGRRPRRGARPAQHHRLGQTLHGPRSPTRTRPLALQTSSTPGRGSLRRWPATTVAGGGLRRDPACSSASAEDSARRRLVGAVITVPAYFDDASARPPRTPRAWPGLNVLRLLNEPTAAPIAYGLDNAAKARGLRPRRRHLRHPLLRLSAGVFEVVATGGDSALGGDDFDARCRRRCRAPASPRRTPPRTRACWPSAARR